MSTKSVGAFALGNVLFGKPLAVPRGLAWRPL